MRPLNACAATLAGMFAALAIVTPAMADPPTRTESELVVDEPSVNFVCPNGSLVLATFSLARTVTVHYDATGSPIMRVRQARVDGTLYSDDLSRSVPYGARIHRVEDLIEDTNTVTGRLAFAAMPGPDPAATGREVVDLETFETIFQSGRGSAEFESRVCAYLYPGQS